MSDSSRPPEPPAESFPWVMAGVLALWVSQAVEVERKLQITAEFMEAVESEESLPTTSHARCRNCGLARHKIARFNVCQVCWEQEFKPQLRSHWAAIKDRRAQRRAVEHELQRRERQRTAALLQQVEREHAEEQEQKTLALQLLSIAATVNGQEESHNVIEAPTEVNGTENPPPKRTPQEQAAHARAFIANPSIPPGGQKEKDLLRLYESGANIDQIREHFGIGAGAIMASVRRNGIVPRRERPGWKPLGKAAPKGSIQVINGRPEWVPADANVVASVEARPNRTSLSAEQELEVVRLYSETDIPISEIVKTYNIRSYQKIYDLASKYGVPRRGAAPVAVKPAPLPLAEDIGMRALVDAVALAKKLQAEIDELKARQNRVSAPFSAERSWAVNWEIRRAGQQVIAAPTMEEAVRLVREQIGEDVDITGVVRA